MGAICRLRPPVKRVRHQTGFEHMKTFLNYLNDESGASAAEYALILAIVGAAIGAAMFLLGGNIKTAINTASTCISQASSGGC